MFGNHPLCTKARGALKVIDNCQKLFKIRSNFATFFFRKLKNRNIQLDHGYSDYLYSLFAGQQYFKLSNPFGWPRHKVLDTITHNSFDTKIPITNTKAKKMRLSNAKKLRKIMIEEAQSVIQ